MTHTKKYDVFYNKSRFVGISQADRAGLEKAPRWGKFGVKLFKPRHAWTLLLNVILSLSLSNFRRLNSITVITDYGEAGMGQTRHTSSDELSLRTKANVTQSSNWTDGRFRRGCPLTPLTFARHRLSPLATFTSGAISSQWKAVTHWQWICEFYTANFKGIFGGP